MNLNDFILKSLLISYCSPETLDNIEKFEKNWKIVIPTSYKNFLLASSSTHFNSKSKILSENLTIGDRIALYSIDELDYSLKNDKLFRQETKIIFENEDNMIEIGTTDYNQSIFIGIKGEQEGQVFIFESYEDADLDEDENGFFVFPHFKISNTFEEFLDFTFALAEPNEYQYYAN